MYGKFDSKSYPVTETGVRFHTEDKVKAYVFNRAEDICEQNVAMFGDTKVLMEGAKYTGVWLETQPMGGEMYASRNMEIGANNHLIFMKNQRRDGRVPGMIRYDPPWKGVTVHYDWFQGDFFTPSAMRMYYLLGKDKNYLSLLYDFLRDFDEYLWANRANNPDRCLEAWCVWDTAEDNSTELLANGLHAHNNGAWCGEKPPKNHGKMPFRSTAFMAYSYSHLTTLAEISDILGNGEGYIWRARAKEVQDLAIKALWDDERGAFYDTDKDGNRIYCLTQKNIKAMYHGLFTQEMAERFVREHLLNPEEFNTAFPLPAIAANDPLFYINNEENNLSPEALAEVLKNSGDDTLDNSWSGPSQGLTYQRSIDALLRYGFHAEVTALGRKLMENLHREQKFVQQYHPHTGKAAEGMDGYGPTALAALEYVTHLCGVDYACDKFTWSSVRDGAASEFTQTLFGDEYTLKRTAEGKATAYKNGEKLFSFTDGLRVITDASGNIKEIYGAETAPTAVTVETKSGEQFNFTAQPNGKYTVDTLRS
ncbi:MAG: hypothetical protein IJY04_00110 [Clostridia bacterium]|nr:hypothetical protein [Clostridia bacterium]